MAALFVSGGYAFHCFGFLAVPAQKKTLSERRQPKF
jgi:hypothetical protein